MKSRTVCHAPNSTLLLFFLFFFSLPLHFRLALLSPRLVSRDFEIEGTTVPNSLVADRVVVFAVEEHVSSPAVTAHDYLVARSVVLLQHQAVG